MANLLKAMVQYGPRLELNSTAQLDEVAELMAMPTGLKKHEVMMVLQEQSEVITLKTRWNSSLNITLRERSLGVFFLLTFY